MMTPRALVDYCDRMWTAVDNIESALNRIATAMEGKALPADPTQTVVAKPTKSKAKPSIATATPAETAPVTPATPSAPVASAPATAPAHQPSSATTSVDPLDFGDTKLEPVTPEVLREYLNKVIEKCGKDTARKIVVEVGNAQSFSLIKPAAYGDVVAACAEALK
jgi:hypothetical protein